MSLKKESDAGQAMLIGVLLGLLLLLTIPVMVYMNQMTGSHQILAQRNSRARAIALEGISYAIQELNVSSTVWNNALLNNTFTGTDCNTGNEVKSPSGGKFKLTCSNSSTSNPNLQPYEVSVIAVGYLSGVTGGSATGGGTTMRAVRSYLSQRTLGVDLGSGIHSGAALELVNAPAPGAGFNVWWGSIVCLDTVNPWVLTGAQDSINQPTTGTTAVPGFPRKFSAGAITGTLTNAPFIRTPNKDVTTTTDSKEYWAYASMDFAPIIDDDFYLNSAKANTAPAPNAANGITWTPGATVTSTNGEYFITGGTLKFDNNFTMPPGSLYVYVHGDVEWNDLKVDVGTGAFVVTGSLTMRVASNVDPFILNPRPVLHFPKYAALEFPYWTQGPGWWPCYGTTPGGTCSAGATGSDNFKFKGFLWVKNNLIIDGDWRIIGSVMVGDVTATASGTFQTTTGSFNLFYDDTINQAIQVRPVQGAAIKIATDSIQDIP